MIILMFSKEAVRNRFSQNGMHRLYRFKSSLNRSRKSVDSKHVSIGDRACRIDERKGITSEFFAEGKEKDSQVSRKGERRKRE